MGRRSSGRYSCLRRICFVPHELLGRRTKEFGPRLSSSTHSSSDSSGLLEYDLQTSPYPYMGFSFSFNATYLIYIWVCTLDSWNCDFMGVYCNCQNWLY